MSLDVTGLQRLSRELSRDADKVLERAAKRALADARKSLAAPKRGKTRRSGGRTHTASARGEAPANQSGRLSASLSEGRTGDAFSVRAAAPYAARLENEMNRPFLAPALERAIPETLNEMTEMVSAYNE